MDTGKKRSANEADVATRVDGAKRRESTGSGEDTKGRPKVAQAIPASAFKARAVPIHVTLTRTPSTVKDDNSASLAPVEDPGFLGAVALHPCTFTTGSYGWKGSKRLAINIVDPINDEKNTVQVMLTINATVMGSKQAGKEAEVEAEINSTTRHANDVEDGGAIGAAERVS
ncbi:hypothetical protein F5148DRAFT_358958 [Russula earlei]|uniref:Uncharacterized protein n=1 Tax=Russula earlei TaxID=71964 RepID=A0ACC0UKK1_9AGAM|nr:hypothetical protein F5148DRAFT_358958 [Russula earlei]